MQDLCPTIDSLIALGFKVWDGQRRPQPKTGDAAVDAMVASHGLAQPSPELADLTTVVVHSFDGFDLFAMRIMNRHFVNVVQVFGVLATQSEIREIDSEIPHDLEEPLAAAAWVSYILRTFNEHTEPLPDWLAEGENHWDLIPFLRSQQAYQERLRAYEATPKCLVAREDARRLRKALLHHLSNADEDPGVTVSFDRGVLVFNFGRWGDFFETRAIGDSWPTSYSVMVTPESELPQRFYDSWVEVTRFEGNLCFDMHPFGRLEAIDVVPSSKT